MCIFATDNELIIAKNGKPYTTTNRYTYDLSQCGVAQV